MRFWLEKGSHETIAGFVLGALFGLVVGALIVQFPLVERTLYPYVVRNCSMDMAGVFAILVILSVLGIGLHRLVNHIRRHGVLDGQCARSRDRCVMSDNDFP